MGDSADGASASGDGLYGGATAGILETNDLKFHHLHGRNARISNNGATASRPNALGEFNDAIIMSNRFAYFFSSNHVSAVLDPAILTYFSDFPQQTLAGW